VSLRAKIDKPLYVLSIEGEKLSYCLQLSGDLGNLVCHVDITPSGRVYLYGLYGEWDPLSKEVEA